MAKEPKKKTNTNAKKTTTTKKRTTTTVKKTTTPKKVETKNVEPKKVEKKEEVKEVIKTEPKLDYKMVLIVILALLILVIGLAKIGGVFENKDFSNSYLLKNKVITNELKKENISSTLLNNEVFIFVTSLNNEEEYNLEKNLKKVIKDNDLKDNFYIYIKDENDKLSELFGIDDSTKTPTVLYYKNGSLVDKVEREDEKMIEAADFAKLLDIYELSKEE